MTDHTTHPSAEELQYLLNDISTLGLDEYLKRLKNEVNDSIRHVKQAMNDSDGDKHYSFGTYVEHMARRVGKLYYVAKVLRIQPMYIRRIETMLKSFVKLKDAAPKKKSIKNPPKKNPPKKNPPKKNPPKKKA